MKLPLTLYLAIFFTLSAFGKENAEVSVFAFGGVGFGGITSEGEFRFGEALTSENPSKALREWYANGNNEEKAYCMVGFYYLDRNQYEESKKKHQGTEFKIKAAQYCEVFTLSLPSLTHMIEKGMYKSYVDKPTVRPAQASKGEQGGTGQPATRSESKSEGGDKPQPASEGRSR